MLDKLHYFRYYIATYVYRFVHIFIQVRVLLIRVYSVSTALMMWQNEHTEVTHIPAKCQISHLMHGAVGLPVFHEPSAYRDGAVHFAFPQILSLLFYAHKLTRSVW